MAIPVFVPGQVLNASDVNTWLQPVAPVKTANETVNNSAALQNDDHLFTPIAANAKYAFWLCLDFESNTTADFRFDFTGPAGFAIQGICTSVSSTTSDIREVGTPTVPPANGVTNMLWANGHMTTTGTAGTLQFRWAQGTATAVNTIIFAGSFLMLQRIG